MWGNDRGNDIRLQCLAQWHQGGIYLVFFIHFASSLAPQRPICFLQACFQMNPKHESRSVNFSLRQKSIIFAGLSDSSQTYQKIFFFILTPHFYHLTLNEQSAAAFKEPNCFVLFFIFFCQVLRTKETYFRKTQYILIFQIMPLPCYKYCFVVVSFPGFCVSPNGNCQIHLKLKKKKKEKKIYRRHLAVNYYLWGLDHLHESDYYYWGVCGCLEKQI